MINICIIPARRNSKRIKQKNIKIFFGKPIIYWSIKAAIKSKCFDKIIVSTDSKKIAQISKKCGAEVPFLRPKKLSGDHVPVAPVLRYTINKLGGVNKVKNVCCLLATAPFIDPRNLQKGLKILKKKKVEFVFSATDYDFPIQKFFNINKKGILKNFKKKFLNKRSQDFQKAYHDAAQFYWASAKTFLSKKTIYTGKSFPYLIPNYESNDVDDQNDWKKTEIIFRLKKRLI